MMKFSNFVRVKKIVEKVTKKQLIVIKASLTKDGKRDGKCMPDYNNKTLKVH